MKDHSPHIETRIWVGLGLATLLVVVIGVTAYRSATRFVESAGQEMRIYSIETELESLLSQLTDIEAGARGYVITGHEQYLQRYRTAATVAPSLEGLRQLLRDSPEQQRRLDALEPLVAHEISLSQQTINARSTAGLEAAAEFLQRVGDREVLDAIRNVVQEMKAAEWQSMLRYETAEHGSGHDTMRSFWFLTVIVVALLAALAYLFQRDVTMRQQAQTELQAAYQELDHRVEERTAELARSNELLRQEIAGHTRARAAQRKSEERFTQFMQHLPGVAFMKDIEGRYVYVNDSFETLFQLNLSQCAGRTDYELWPAAFAAQFSQNDRQVVRTGAALQTTETVPHTEGLHHWLVTKFPLFNDAGAVHMVAGVAIDITERQRAEEALREMQKLAQQRDRLADVGAIAAQIVHDLGNPLAGMSMQAQLLLRRAKADDHQPVSIAVRPIEQILGEVHRLDSLIKGFMEFARDQRLDPKPVDLPRFLQDVVDLWQPVAAAREIALTIETPGDGVSLTADPDKLRRVLDNLVKNAIEAIEQGPGKVRIQVAPAPDAVRISVTDTGIGVPEAVQGFRLFETTKAHGSGLGLAVVKQIVLAHRGSVEFTRLTPHGTVFHIDLPRSGPAGPTQLS
jgi:PAS domain S-box-containing protein